MRLDKSTTLILAMFIVLLFSLGEYRLMERLLFTSELHTGFVLLNIEGVVTGHPAGRVFQNRLLGPYMITSLATLLDSSLLFALKLYTLFMVTLGNILLFWAHFIHFPKRSSARVENRAILFSFAAVTTFGLIRLLNLYLLEYPWDLIDIIIYLLFGYWVVLRRPKWLLPLLFLTALLNRESCLFILFWFVLEAFWGKNTNSFPVRPGDDSMRRNVDWWKFLSAGLLFLGTMIFIYGVRQWLFIAPTPVAGVDLDVEQLGNNWNLTHNVQQFLFYNWRSSLLFVNLSLATAVVLLIKLYRYYPVAVLWTGCWLVSIFAFGFINETRLYSPLFAFWIMYLPLTLFQGSQVSERSNYRRGET